MSFWKFAFKDIEWGLIEIKNLYTSNPYGIQP